MFRFATVSLVLLALSGRERHSLAHVMISGTAGDRDAICETLSKELVGQMSAPPLNRDYRLYRVHAFYSEKLDACIHVEAKLIGVEVFVRDLTRTVIKNANAYYPPALLHCDVSGIDEADIGAVRRHRGFVADVPYRQWLTDGQGGLPRALKTPDEPFDRVACENALDRWLVLWGKKRQLGELQRMVAAPAWLTSNPLLLPSAGLVMLAGYHAGCGLVEGGQTPRRQHMTDEELVSIRDAIIERLRNAEAAKAASDAEYHDAKAAADTLKIGQLSNFLKTERLALVEVIWAEQVA